MKKKYQEVGAILLPLYYYNPSPMKNAIGIMTGRSHTRCPILRWQSIAVLSRPPDTDRSKIRHRCSPVKGDQSNNSQHDHCKPDHPDELALDDEGDHNPRASHTQADQL